MTELPEWPITNDDGVPAYVLPYDVVPPDVDQTSALAALGDVICCGECDFRTAVAVTPMGVLPILYLSFRDQAHRPLKTIAMILDVTYMQHFKEQLTLAINDGIRKAKARGAS